MTYYPTLDEDLARAKEILAKGKAEADNEDLPEAVRAWLASQHGGGTIYGADIYAAYMLLKSFVAEIERLRDLPDPLSGLRHAKYLNPACGENGCQWLRATYEIERLRDARVSGGGGGAASNDVIAGLCGARLEGGPIVLQPGPFVLYCTRPKGHEGEHVAAVGPYDDRAHVLARWKE